jgi:predicted RNase H-like nuclease (RuvC/YqgF family)
MDYTKALQKELEKLQEEIKQLKEELSDKKEIESLKLLHKGIRKKNGCRDYGSNDYGIEMWTRTSYISGYINHLEELLKK